MKTNITLETLTKAITWSVLSFIFFRLALVITNAFFLSSSDKDFIYLHRTLYPFFSIGNGLSRFLIMVFTLGWFFLAGKHTGEKLFSSLFVHPLFRQQIDRRGNSPTVVYRSLRTIKSHQMPRLYSPFR